MATRRVTTYLEPDEGAALYEGAYQGCRDIRDQARYYIRRGLQQDGLLPTEHLEGKHKEPQGASTREVSHAGIR
jgi:hypothetical protein